MAVWQRELREDFSSPQVVGYGLLTLEAGCIRSLDLHVKGSASLANLILLTKHSHSLNPLFRNTRKDHHQLRHRRVLGPPEDHPLLLSLLLITGPRTRKPELLRTQPRRL